MIAALVVAAGCGVRPDPEIAAQLARRLDRPAPGWDGRACPDRSAKVDRLRDLVPLVHDLEGRVRQFATPMVPELVERVDRRELVGIADDWRCVVQDYLPIDLEREPNYLAGQHSMANILMLQAERELQGGDAELGWRLALEAIALYRDPIGPQLGEQLELADSLGALRALIERFAPPPAAASALADAVDRSLLPRATACTALRYELVTLAIGAWRGHLGSRERERVARRYGTALTARMWQPSKPGYHDRAAWDEWVIVHDGIAKHCEKAPLARTVKAVGGAVARLDAIDPPIGAMAAAVVEHVKQYAALVDAQFGMSVALRAIELQHRLGRDPTPGELIAAIRIPLRGEYDGATPKFEIDDGVLVIVRGGMRHELPLPGSARWKLVAQVRRHVGAP